MDMTFCKYYKECKKGNECSRALTDKVKKDAEKWWKGNDPPICIFAEKPDCYEE
jgi:hypothetical protein